MGSCQSTAPFYNEISDEVLEWSELPPHNPTRSRIFRTPRSMRKHNDRLPRWNTTRDIFQTGLSKSPHQNCVGQRQRHLDGTFGDYQWMTYTQLEKASLQIGTSLNRLDLCPEKDFPDEMYSNARRLKPLGVFAKNCPEWLITEQASNAFNYTLVPLYDTLGDDALVFITQQTQMECIIVSVECLPILNRVIDQMRTIKSIVLLDVRPWITMEIPSKDDPQRAAYAQTFAHLLKSYRIVHPGQLSTNDSTVKPGGKEDNVGEQQGSRSTTCSMADVVTENEATSMLSQMQSQSASSCTPINLYLWSSLMSYGEVDTMPPMEINPDDVQTLCYTSGTTGFPKGAVITHRSLICNLVGLLEIAFIGTSIEMGTSDVHASYLPLAHIYERIIVQLCYSAGGSIGIYSGEITRLFEDIGLLRPTISVGVPRVYSKLLDNVKSKMAGKSFIVQQLYQRGVESKLHNLRTYGAVTHSVYDRLIFSKINEQVFGGRVRFFICSAAALDINAEEMMQVIFSAPMLPAYGLTECIGAACCALPGDPTLGHVGGIIPWGEFCLESVPEMEADALADPPKGEVLIRGTGIAKGYFMETELTKEAFTEGGWYHTGDIGTILPNNALKIIDRKKNIFKLSQGEYITPERIEAVYSRANLIAQLFIYGESDKDHLVAIVVPDIEMVPTWAKNNQIEVHEIGDLIKDQRFIEAVTKEMHEMESGLKGFERVKLFRLIETPFTIDNELLTPTLKLKRSVAKKRFYDLIIEMYSTPATRH